MRLVVVVEYSYIPSTRFSSQLDKFDTHVFSLDLISNLKVLNYFIFFTYIKGVHASTRPGKGAGWLNELSSWIT